MEFNPNSLQYYNPKHLNSEFKNIEDIRFHLDTYNELIRLEKNNY